MPHDFVRFPELTNNQMAFYYFQSPHRQITEDFRAQVTRVIDGDTIMVKWRGRDFDFPIRFIGTAAPEKGEAKGEQSKQWLKTMIEKKEVEIVINRENRVGKFGRLLGRVLSGGLDINEESIRAGKAVPFDQQEGLLLPDFNKEIGKFKI